MKTNRVNPYEKCPVIETESYTYRLVNEKDAEDLLSCYSDEEAIKLFNSDNCTSDFRYATIDQMSECVHYWLEEYRLGRYIRFSIVDKSIMKVIGTIEFFAKEKQFSGIRRIGVLRLDLLSTYETREGLNEILGAIIENFYDLFEVDGIITKCISIPESKVRRDILGDKGFKVLQDVEITAYQDYHIR